MKSRRRKPAKINRPESARSRIAECEGGGSVRGENPSSFRQFECTSKQRSGVSFCLSHSSDFQGLKDLPRFQCEPHAEGDIGRPPCGSREWMSLIARVACPRGCSSAGRAPALQAGGQRFEPAHLHQHIDNRIGLSRSPECRSKQESPKIQWSFWGSKKSGSSFFNSFRRDRKIISSATEEWFIG